MAREDKVRQVTHLLRMAENAHHYYEVCVLQGGRDDRWFDWYAEYLIGHGLDRILEEMLPVERIAHFLATVDEVRKASVNPTEWSAGMAKRMVDTLV